MAKFRNFQKNLFKKKHNQPSNGNVTERLDPLRKGAGFPIILGVFKVAVLGIAISLLAGKAVLGASALASEPSLAGGWLGEFLFAGKRRGCETMNHMNPAGFISVDCLLVKLLVLKGGYIYVLIFFIFNIV